MGDERRALTQESAAKLEQRESNVQKFKLFSSTKKVLYTTNMLHKVAQVKQEVLFGNS